MLLTILLMAAAFSVEAQEPAVDFSTSWQQTLDSIKAAAKEEMAKNNSLSQQHQGLVMNARQLADAIAAKRQSNERLTAFLRERNGRTDQQIRIEELNGQIAAAKKQVDASTKGLASVQKEWQSLQRTS